eukprot:COSAG03_NODE_25347_length_266_cov_0.622754_1_plen_41_part_10
MPCDARCTADGGNVASDGRAKLGSKAASTRASQASVHQGNT